jgi:hypothetical protein
LDSEVGESGKGKGNYLEFNLKAPSKAKSERSREISGLAQIYE